MASRPAPPGRGWGAAGGRAAAPHPVSRGLTAGRGALVQAPVRIDGRVTAPYHRRMERVGKASESAALWRTSRLLVQACRPRQWTKNLLVYIALFFTVNEAWSLANIGQMVELFGKTTLAFVLFSAISGACYLVNDVADARRDRLHPIKRLRPIASGALPRRRALTAACVLAVAGVASSFLLEPLFGGVAAAYLAATTVYTFVFKRIVVLDVFAIAAGFVLRAVAGAVVIQVPVSPWLYICTGVGALFIALAKRRSEAAAAPERAADQRNTLHWYRRGFLLDLLISLAAGSLVSVYILYTLYARNLPANYSMMLTIPFVTCGVLRYVYLMKAKNAGERPEEVLTTDVPLIVAVVSWLATASTVLVLFRE